MRELINETTLDMISGWLSEEWWTSGTPHTDPYREAELISALGEIKGMMDLRNELLSRIKVKDKWEVNPDIIKKYAQLTEDSLRVSANE